MEFGSVQIRVILEPDEGALSERLVERVCSFAGFDLEGFRNEHPGQPIRTKRFSLSITQVEGLTGPLQVLRARVDSKRDAAAVFARLADRLDEDDRKVLASTVSSRTDEANCYIRLDKKLFLNDSFVLVDHGQCIHFTFSILTYPKSREQAIRFVEEQLSAQ